MADQAIDLTKVATVMSYLQIKGNIGPAGVYPVHAQAISDAIAAIQSNPDTALLQNYISVSKFAAFPLWIDTPDYGSASRQGEPIFSIKRTASALNGAITLVPDCLYVLWAVQQFANLGLSNKNLFEFYELYVAAQAEADNYVTTFNTALIPDMPA